MVAVLLALSAAVVVHHAEAHDDGMGVMAMPMLVMCLAVMPLAAAVGVALGGIVPAPPGLRLLLARPLQQLLAPAPQPRARSSPVLTVVLRC